jgi:hypothetical protein
MARLPAPLHKQLEASAKANDLSLNTELVNRLERSFDYGMVENVLTLAYGPPPVAQGLIEAYRRGMLRLRDEDVAHIKGCLNRWADQLQTALNP